ncbi:MAG TPA: hypothetical protein VJJ47_01495 [Candidatus Paceibacterota bacterium]
MGLLSRHKKDKAEAEKFYRQVGQVFCPYFGKPVVFNSDGFHHRQFSAGNERSKQEQLLKFSLLRAAPSIIKNSGTIQEHRKTMEAVGAPRFGSGWRPMKEVEHWGLIAITGENQSIRVKVVLRRVGAGNITFWSVMPNHKFRSHLASFGIQEN